MQHRLYKALEKEDRLLYLYLPSSVYIYIYLFICGSLKPIGNDEGILPIESSPMPRSML